MSRTTRKSSGSCTPRRSPRSRCSCRTRSSRSKGRRLESLRHTKSLEAETEAGGEGEGVEADVLAVADVADGGDAVVERGGGVGADPHVLRVEADAEVRTHVERER